MVGLTRTTYINWKEKMKVNKYIDHSLVIRDGQLADVDRMCDEAIANGFASVVLHPTWVKHTVERLKGTGVTTTVVFGFPYGTQATETKVFEAMDAINKGVDELDMVINVGKLKDGDVDYLKKELDAVRAVTKGYPIKLILENGILTKDQIRLGTKLGVESGWDYIKTSTAIQTTGATLEDIEIMKEVIQGRAKIKASGGIRTYEDAVKFINAGASRLGTSSGLKIIEGQPKDEV